MKRRPIALSLATVASAMLTMTVASAEPRGVVELFTSQGCSSCPPADKLAGELARDPSLIVLSLPVDYWDYLGWRDTLALPGHTKRQRAYSKARGDREVYTPQAVVNGVKHVLGSDKAAIESAVTQTRNQPGTLALPVSVSVAGEQISVSVAAGKNGAAQGEVWLCPITTNAEVAIGRGENSGHTITYHNVVRRWVKLGEWTGAARSFTLPKQDVGDVDAVAVLVQSGTKEEPGPMLGASVASLR
ncbi:MAG: DUF1223 domain-containing protein [Alphaproteobacteria bacterium]|nr:MAG: DUF1223 domain-containing protein [Alphaproteobacteria bacterium]